MIILKCVKEGSRLRIRFHCFINHENNIFTNVYNNNYNCTFPKDIRVAGAFYKVEDRDIALTSKGGAGRGTFYYSIKRSNIKVMTEEEKQQILTPTPRVDLSTIQIFDAGDCVICLSSASCVVFVPCGHQCVCGSCNTTLKSNRYNCPVCREKITQDILNT